MSTKVTCTLFLVFFAVMASGQKQVATLFDQYNHEGNNITIYQSYSSDLSSDGFDNLPHSACVTGVWIFYQDPNFNPKGEHRVEPIFGRDKFCVNFHTISGTISSARYAGAPGDYRIDSLTIYEYENFQGREEYTFKHSANLELLAGSHKSIIITGNSNWTVFDEPNFQGNSVCLQVPEQNNFAPLIIRDIQKSSKLNGYVKYGSIQSVRIGCEMEDDNVTMSSFRTE